MADVKISNLTALTAVADADEFVIVDSGTTKKITRKNLLGTADVTLDNNIVLTGGGTISTTSNGDIALMPNGTGKVGIGSASPTELLEISSTGSCALQLMHDSDSGETTNALIKFAQHGNANADWHLGSYGAGDTVFVVGSSDTPGGASELVIERGSAEALRIDSSGRVGIGTANPQYDVDVLKSVSGGTVALRVSNSNTAANSAAMLYLGAFGASGTGDPYIYFNDDSNDWAIGVDKSDSSKFKISDNSSVGTNDRLVIDTSGRVGIGPTAPSYRCHISTNSANDQILLHLQEDADGDQMTAQFELSDTGISGLASKNLVIKGGSSSSDMAFSPSTGAAGALVLKADGNVGIGDSSPDAHLDVEKLDIAGGTAGYVGIFSNHQLDSETASDGSYYGIKSIFDINGSAVEVADVVGIYAKASSTDSEASSNALIASESVVLLTSAAGMAKVYGSKILADINGGTVNSDVVGDFIDIDVESGCTLSGSVMGSYVQMDCGTNPTDNPGVFGYFARVNSTVDYAYYMKDDSSVRFRIDDVGQVDAEGTINQSQSLDYAEYFESSDGSVIPVGTSVKLDSGKIVVCEEGDSPMGVIRPVGSSAFVGGGQIFHWKDRFAKDDYGADIWESYTLTKWSEEITFEEYSARGKDETGGSMGGILTDSKVEGSKAIEAVEAVEAQDAVYETVVVEEAIEAVEEILWSEEDELPEDVEVGDVKTEAVEAQEAVTEERLVSEAVQSVDGIEGVAEVPNTYFREHKYHSDRIPEGLTVPEDAEVLENAKYERQQDNPDYNESLEYEPREERDEWHIVGLLGQIPITKGQPTGNWVKMKDVSDTVEMYFVK